MIVTFYPYRSTPYTMEFIGNEYFKWFKEEKTSKFTGITISVLQDNRELVLMYCINSYNVQKEEYINCTKNLDFTNDMQDLLAE